MEFLYVLLAIVAFFAIYPFARYLCKRISLAVRLKRACKKRGARLIHAHPLWLLGGRRGKSCDLHIETDSEIISVKLFQMLRRSSSLHLNSSGQYQCEHLVLALFGRIGGSSSLTVKTKPRHLPYYDFGKGLPDTDKPQKRLLLVHPVCSSFFIQSKEPGKGENEAYIGYEIGDCELYSLSPLIRYLDKEG